MLYKEPLANIWRTFLFHKRFFIIIIIPYIYIALSGNSTRFTERALERTLWAHGTEWALKRTLWAHGTEQALERTLWASGTEWALKRTLWAHGTERALEWTMWAHGTANSTQGQVEIVLQWHLGVPVWHPGFWGLGQAPPEEDQEAGLLCHRPTSDFPEVPGVFLNAPISLTDVKELPRWTHVCWLYSVTGEEHQGKTGVWVQM